MTDVEIKYLDPRYTNGEWGPINYATAGAAAVDLRIVIKEGRRQIWPNETLKFGTGVALNMSDYPDFAFMVIPRSGLGSRGIILQNTIGLIDSDYQGEITLFMRNEAEKLMVLEDGMRAAQGIFTTVLKPNLVVVKEFVTATERGTGGFGSTGNS